MDDAAQQLDEGLAGGWRTTVRRVGDVIHRGSGPWSPSVIRLLHHLHAEGFVRAPTPVGTGFDEDGNEAITFVDGSSPQPSPWSDEAVFEIGAMVRQLRRATDSFAPSPDDRWQDWFGRHLGQQERMATAGHGDLGPWNIMAIDGMPSGFIDWERSGPYDEAWELAQVGWLNAQLHDDDIAERVGLGNTAHRARQLKLLLDGYELATRDREGFVDRMVAFAVHDSRNEAIEHNVGPESSAAIAADGYPVLWGISWRVKSASWMLSHRALLDRAIMSHG